MYSGCIAIYRDILSRYTKYCRDILNIVAIYNILLQYTIYCKIYWQYIAKYLNMQYIAICATRILQSLRYMKAAYCNIYCLAKKSSRILTIYGSPSLVHVGDDVPIPNLISLITLLYSTLLTLSSFLYKTYPLPNHSYLHTL